MFSGNLILSLTASAALLATAGYFLGVIGRNNFVSLGRRSYWTFAGLTTCLSALFLWQIVAHNFQIEYVYGYSSRDLPFFLLLSTFWAGQVGTFLLWLLIAAIIGLFLYRQTDRNGSTVMFFYMLAVLFLLVLLVVSSPFKLLPELPADGKGLNPLLQNFWMIIHPPVVFIGYGLLAVPFSYAMAALTRNRYTDWGKKAYRWVLVSSVALGLGIFLGGYWAYETLGWGGYWAWDPVENASLVPWLTNVALLHGLMVERRYGQLRKTNLLLAVAGFLLVLYGTFLTRSGVLADFSVHSFTDLGLNTYMAMFLALFLAAFLLLILLRFRAIKPDRKYEKLLSTHTLLASAIIVTTLFALLILVGTSSPLITRLPIFEAPGNVGASFYSGIAIPIGVLMALLAGASQFLISRSPTLRGIVWRSLPSVAFGLLCAAGSLAMGITALKYSALIFFAGYTLSANLQVLLTFPNRFKRALGGHMAHAGFGLLLIGFIASTVLARSERAALTRGAPTDMMGYTVTYTGTEGEITEVNNSVNVELEKDGHLINADPELFYDPYNRGLMKRPYVRSYLLQDLYVAPEQIQSQQPGSKTSLTKGEVKQHEGMDLTFEGFDMSSHAEDGAVTVGARITVVDDADTSTIVPTLSVMSDGNRKKPPVRIGDTGLLAILEEVFPDRKQVELRIAEGDGEETEMLVLEISTKPLIVFVWIGSIMVLMGTSVSLYNRWSTSSLD